MSLRSKLVWLLIAVVAVGSCAYGLVYALQGSAVRARLTASDAEFVEHLFWVTSLAHLVLFAVLGLTIMRAQLIESGEVDTLPAARRHASIIVTQTHRMTRIISEILSFARKQPARPSRLDLVQVVRNGIALSDHIARRRKLSIQLEAPQQPLELDGLEQRYACIGVLDHGTGISKQSLPQIFEPFFSSKRAGEGTGLGLSVAQGIAKEHDGFITVSSELGQGSSFEVYLPCDGRKDGDLYDAQAALRR